MMTKLKSMTLIAGVCALAFAYGCILSPDDSGGGPPVPPAVFKDLTQKEDVVYNLALSYNKADIAQYQKLLHEGYRFYNQTVDVQGGMEEFRTRDWDINSATKMFLAARGQLTSDPAKNLDKLTLEITDGSWTAQDTVPGLPAPCVDCWVTMREYKLNLMLVGGQQGYNGYDNVQMIIVPVEEGGKKLYKLYRVDDIAK